MRFDSYHPTINLIYFSAAVFCAVDFNHPCFMIIAWAGFFMYSVVLNGRRGLVFNLCLMPLVLLYGCVYTGYNHFGVTALRENIIGNAITLESFVYGLTIGLRAATVLMIFSCVFSVFSSDKVVYLFGRLSPRLSLFLSIILRSQPLVKKRASLVNTARRGIGKGAGQGSVLRRLRNAVGIFSILITWTLESFAGTSVSMKSRGFLLRGRSAYSIYRFDNRARGFVIGIVICLAVVAAAVLLDQTAIYYDPEIVMNRVTPVSVVFYVAYAVFITMPAALQTAGEWNFGRQRRAIEEI